MTRIPEIQRDIMEKAIYLPMLLTILNRDLQVVKISNFKLKQPYIDLIENSMKAVQLELKKTKSYMYRHTMKIQEVNRDEAFTMFLFIYNGYEEFHNYFNPRLRNKAQELLEYYLYKRFTIS
ncbi:hypothetical protein AB1L07_14680 [Niallia alba]|uniref:YhjD n=1 Tax=Niallia circulans TaxID=1397 RepID=A0A941JQZ9_NIACI|nr:MULTISPECIES: hypothetical protein [Niallia]EOR24903.1 protein YhjD [Niallia nealsonii AAU1]MCB5236650.1 hypothetical protein [Niallia circulans]MDU1846136.1 hypothetical protein [Niallia nealsonii]MED3792035.1 hypothetical protein [Niallia alba]